MNGPDGRRVSPLEVVDDDQHGCRARADLEELGQFLEEPEPLVARTFEGSQLVPAQDRRRSRAQGGKQRRERDEGLDFVRPAGGDHCACRPRHGRRFGEEPALPEPGVALDDNGAAAAPSQLLDEGSKHGHLVHATEKTWNRHTVPARARCMRVR